MRWSVWNTAGFSQSFFIFKDCEEGRCFKRRSLIDHLTRRFTTATVEMPNISTSVEKRPFPVRHPRLFTPTLEINPGSVGEGFTQLYFGSGSAVLPVTHFINAGESRAGHPGQILLPTWTGRDTGRPLDKLNRKRLHWAGRGRSPPAREDPSLDLQKSLGKELSFIF